jgi:hypothetical protein
MIFEAIMIIVSRRRIIALRMINVRTILVVSTRRSSTTVMIVPTNNSAVKINTIMTIINFLFRERAMFAVEQLL